MANSITPGIETRQLINSEVAKVSFEIYENDLCLLQMSETWKRFQNFLEETQNKSSQMSLREKTDLLEGKVI